VAAGDWHSRLHGLAAWMFEQVAEGLLWSTYIAVDKTFEKMHFGGA